METVSDFLTPAALRALVGSPRTDKQVSWLRANRWRFELDRFGKPKVARAYFDRRMVGVDTPEPKGETMPNWAAIGG